MSSLFKKINGERVYGKQIFLEKSFTWWLGRKISGVKYCIVYFKKYFVQKYINSDQDEMWHSPFFIADSCQASAGAKGAEDQVQVPLDSWCI